MADQQRRDFANAHLFAHKAAESVATLRVERRKRLVHQQRIGLGQQGAHQRDTCRLPAGQRRRITPTEPLETGDAERVEPQPGGFYGGWVTSRVVGPFKGAPGTWGW